MSQAQREKIVNIFNNRAPVYYKSNALGFYDIEEKLIDRYFRNKKKLLILGCGAGRTLLPLYKKGYDITAIDVADKMVEFSKQAVGTLPISVLKMNANDLKFENNTFDAVFFPFHGLNYLIGDVFRCVNNVRRVLKQDGVFIFSTHNRFCMSGKRLRQLFEGRVAHYGEIPTYRMSHFDYFTANKYFKNISIIPYRQSKEKIFNFRAKIFYCLRQIPIFSKTLYFICHNPIKNNLI